MSTTATKPIPSLRGLTYQKRSPGYYTRHSTKRVEFTDQECEILERVATMAEKTHWIKGAYEQLARFVSHKKNDPPDKVCGCMVGLLNIATREVVGHHNTGQGANDRVNLHGRILAVIQALYKRNSRWGSIEAWNDDEDTIRSHVVRVAREAQKLRADA